ncbi:hypothetical protein ACFXPA_41790 [Amycolatopsis sp. NPDC059090]|uniref:hypothetical protein n=1 Tax=Amycolatopsis sp. NPDC059090 TaxID=3346723 RepID=UPI00366F8BA6
MLGSQWAATMRELVGELTGPRPALVADRERSPRQQEQAWAEAEAEVGKLLYTSLRDAADWFADRDAAGRRPGELLPRRGKLPDPGRSAAVLSQLAQRRGRRFVDGLVRAAGEALRAELGRDSGLSAQEWHAAAVQVAARAAETGLADAERRAGELALADAGPAGLAEAQRAFEQEHRPVIESAAAGLAGIEAQDGGAAAVQRLQAAARLLLGEEPSAAPGVGLGKPALAGMYRDLVTVLAFRLSQQQAQDAWQATSSIRGAAEALRVWTPHGDVPVAWGTGWDAEWSEGADGLGLGPGRRWESGGSLTTAEGMRRMTDRHTRRWAGEIVAGERALAALEEPRRSEVAAQARRLVQEGYRLENTARPPQRAWDENGNPLPGLAWRLRDGTLTAVRHRAQDRDADPDRELVWAVGPAGQDALGIGVDDARLATLREDAAMLIVPEVTAQLAQQDKAADADRHVEQRLAAMTVGMATRPGFSSLDPGDDAAVARFARSWAHDAQLGTAALADLTDVEQTRALDRAEQALAAHPAFAGVVRKPAVRAAIAILAQALAPLVHRQAQLRDDLDSFLSRRITPALDRLMLGDLAHDAAGNPDPTGTPGIIQDLTGYLAAHGDNDRRRAYLQEAGRARRDSDSRTGGLPLYAEQQQPPAYREQSAPDLHGGTWEARFAAAREALAAHPEAAGEWRRRAAQMLTARPRAGGGHRQSEQAAWWHAGLIDLIAEAGRAGGRGAAEDMLVWAWVDAVIAGADQLLEGSPEPQVVGLLAARLQALPDRREREFWRLQVFPWAAAPPPHATRDQVRSLAPAHQVYLDALAFIAYHDRGRSDSRFARFAPTRIPNPDQIVRYAPAPGRDERRDAAQLALDQHFARAAERAPHNPAPPSTPARRPRT